MHSFEIYREERKMEKYEKEEFEEISFYNK